MAYKCIEKDWCADAGEYIYKFICDTDADVETLPECCAGSKALIVESGKICMVNASGEWRPFGEA